MDTATARGRPRSAAVHQAILDAALDLFIEVGIAAMTMEGVAARAGVAKTTVYRRWAGKDELVLEAVELPMAQVHPPNSGSLRCDLVQLVERMHRLLLSSRLGEVMPRMAAEIHVGSPLGRAYVERIIGPRVAVVRGVLEAALARGDLRTELDVATLHDMLMGPVILARNSGRLPTRGITARAERIVDAVLHGIDGHRED